MDKELEDFLDEYSKIICALINAFKDYIYSLRSFINSIIIIICSICGINTIIMIYKSMHSNIILIIDFCTIIISIMLLLYYKYEYIKNGSMVRTKSGELAIVYIYMRNNMTNDEKINFIEQCAKIYKQHFICIMRGE